MRNGILRLLSSAFLFACFARADIDPKKVYVAASDDAASQAVAREYCAARGIPEGNIFTLKIPASRNGRIARGQYFEFVEAPTMRALAKLGAVRGEFLGFKNSFGREEFALMSFDADFLVLCRGIPWIIDASEGKSEQTPGKTSTTTDAASVDSELAAMFLRQKSLDGPCRNPVFGAFDSPSAAKTFGLLRVARLDGATQKDAADIVKSALEAEAKGIRGRAYIDKSKFNKLGDDWLESCANTLGELGFDVSIDNEKPLFGLDSRMDACAFYFGWYSLRAEGYFAQKSFRSAAGAFGLHIFSFSAANLRDATAWTPALIARGFAGTFGNVLEPYLGITNYPHHAVKALSCGMTAGEAAYASAPALSWQWIFVGDPMYRPFKKDLDAQLADIDAGLGDGLSQYAAIRKMNLISAKDGARSAADFGAKYVGKIEDAALLFKLYQIEPDAVRASAYLARLLAEDIYKPEYAGLAFEVARAAASNPGAAMKIYLRIAETAQSADISKTAAVQAETLSKKSGTPLPESLAALLAAPQ